MGGKQEAGDQDEKTACQSRRGRGNLVDLWFEHEIQSAIAVTSIDSYLSAFWGLSSIPKSPSLGVGVNRIGTRLIALLPFPNADPRAMTGFFNYRSDPEYVWVLLVHDSFVMKSCVTESYGFG